MQVWKPIALIVPAGLVLGAIGGTMVHPEMTQRAAEPWQSAFGRDARPGNSAAAYPAQPEGPMPYVGEYSYPPDIGDRSLPDGSTDRRYADVPLPTVAELDARQAELLADPEIEFAVSPPPNEVAPAAEVPPQPEAHVARGGDIGPEPRTADGQRAIW